MRFRPSSASSIEQRERLRGLLVGNALEACEQPLVGLLVETEQVLHARAPGGDLDALAPGLRVGRISRISSSVWRLSANWPVAACACAMAEQQRDAIVDGAVVGQQAQRGFEPAGGGGGRLRAGLRAGLAQHGDGAEVAVARRALDMVGAGAGGSAALGERRRDALVGADPPAVRRRLVDRAAHDGVAEAEAARHVGVADEVGPSSSSRASSTSGSATVGRGCGELELERVAGHRGAVEHRAAPRRQQRELLGERGGDHGGTCRPASVTAGPEPRPPGGTGQLLEVERVAAALLVAAPPATLAADQRGASSRVSASSSRRVERPGAVRAVKGAAEPRGQLVGPGREREQHAGGGRPVQQRDEQVDRCGVGPVEVVEHEHERLGGRELFEQLPHRAVGPVALVHGGLGAPRPESPATGSTCPSPARTQRPAVEAPRIEALDVLVERVDEDPERQVLLELRPRSGEHDVPRSSARRPAQRAGASCRSRRGRRSRPPAPRRAGAPRARRRGARARWCGLRMTLRLTCWAECPAPGRA